MARRNAGMVGSVSEKVAHQIREMDHVFISDDVFFPVGCARYGYVLDSVVVARNDVKRAVRRVTVLGRSQPCVVMVVSERRAVWAARCVAKSRGALHGRPVAQGVVESFRLERSRARQ